jgi:hypothetical protein
MLEIQALVYKLHREAKSHLIDGTLRGSYGIIGKQKDDLS